MKPADVTVAAPDPAAVLTFAESLLDCSLKRVLMALLAERQQAVKALRRLVQEVENECRGRPSKQRLRHRAAVARRELAALADKEETE